MKKQEANYLKIKADWKYLKVPYCLIDTTPKFITSCKVDDPYNGTT